MNLNKIFTSHMVFSRNLPVRVYGEGKGRVEISFAGQKKSLVSDKDKWSVEFPPMKYGGPYSMEIDLDGKEIILEDIYIGEVFLFAGQSNMQFKMHESNTPAEMYNADNKLRLYSTDRIEKTDFYTSDDGWLVCEKDNIPNWSALAYLTSAEIAVNKDIAVGVITCYQGASIIESWVPANTFKKINIDIPDEKKHFDHTYKDFSAWNGEGILYSYALSQVTPFPVSAVVWYQGESDAAEEEARVYCDELCALIDVWRNDFGNENLPFVVVQLADNINSEQKSWALIQEAQMDVQSKRQNVRTVISADVCENDDIHPKTKYKLAGRISQAVMELLNS